MALRHSQAVTFKPQGLSDTVDATDAFAGAMTTLQNLIPANDTPHAFIPRPGAVNVSTYAGFSSPGFVSASLVVGNIEYGMIASSLNSGKDQPYVYNLLTNTFLTVNGITAANTPTSPASTGAWTPPIMAVVGTRIIVTHPGFPGGATKFGWFDISGFTATFSSTTNGTTALTSATNMITAGIQPGQTVTKADVPAGTTIVSIATNGLSAVMSAAATGSTTSSTTFAGGTTTSPLWGAGDTNINNLPSVPVSVAQFNGRAYYACGNGMVFSDSLLPCNRTLASQALTFANGLPVTALGALPLASPITGGIIQAIIAFQGISALQQITGDSATANLATNVLNAATGTLSPLSITNTNFGLAFMSPDGMRIVEFNANVSDPIGHTGDGVTLPFIYAVQPSRICAAATADVIRISTQNSLHNNAYEEYWFDISLKIWTGPHTFPASLIQPWQNTFIMHPQGLSAGIWRSDAIPNSTTSYTENSVALSFVYQTSLLPDNAEMCENAMVETALALALPGGYNLTISALDEMQNVIQAASITISGSSTLWGGFNWGGANWSANVGAFKQYRVAWPAPIVFKQASLKMGGLCVAGLKLGNSYFRYEKLGYLLQ
jgi:hypothetical protein